MIDYDSIESWFPKLSDALSPVVSSKNRDAIAKSTPKHIEDAMSQLFAIAPKARIVERTLDWIEANTIAAYHGTRLVESEIASIRNIGLVPLAAQTRKTRLTRVLSTHPHWAAIAGNLDHELERHGRGNAAGPREGQVHLTLSRGGLENGFNHYLRYGSEFDQHVAHALVGRDAYSLLEQDGEATIIQVELEGKLALAGAHAHFTIEDLIRTGDTPNLVRDFLEAWAYRLANPKYQPRDSEVDSGIWFRHAIPATKIRYVGPV